MRSKVVEVSSATRESLPRSKVLALNDANFESESEYQ